MILYISIYNLSSLFQDFSEGTYPQNHTLKIYSSVTTFQNAAPFIGFQPISCHWLRQCLKLVKSQPPDASIFHLFLSNLPPLPKPFWSSPRPISDSQLHALPRFHLCPIYLVVFKGSYYLRMGYLILRGASRLDAFSVYPVPTWLPGHALGSATGTPEVSPSRSSRTKDSSSQISYAHAG